MNKRNLSDGDSIYEAPVCKEVLGGFDCTGDGKKYVEYKVTVTGKLYFFFDYRNIWGATWGPRRDILLDNFSIKKVN